MAGDDPDRLLEELHPFDVVVPGVGEVDEPAAADLPNHVLDRLLHGDSRPEPERSLRLLGRDAVAPNHPVGVVDVQVGVDPDFGERSPNPQTQSDCAVYTDFAVTWHYSFESATPLLGNPNSWF